MVLMRPAEPVEGIPMACNVRERDEQKEGQSARVEEKIARGRGGTCHVD